jgi:hypothetical protein
MTSSSFSLLRFIVDDFGIPYLLVLFPHLLDLLAPHLRTRAGTSLSSHESGASWLFLGHMKHTSPQERKFGTTIHAPFNELESIHMPFERTLAAIGSESPANTAALSRFGCL